jgi:hypothetical protein
MHIAFITVMLIVGSIACYVFFQMLKSCLIKGNCLLCINCKNEIKGESN